MSNLNFEQFNYTQDYNQDYSTQYNADQYNNNQYQEPLIPQKVSWQSIKLAFSTGDDEEPLLQELGINFHHILLKASKVVNPVSKIDSHIMDDTDLFGPLIFCFLLGHFTDRNIPVVEW